MELTCNPISLGALYYVTFNVKEAIEYLRLLDGKTIKQPTKEKMTRDNAMSEYGKNMATTEQLKAIFVLKKVLAFL
ncbi:MAG: hypothetical protein LBQ24_05305 [Candidatus Peribacteria bacterium]|jgi:hypothetical protein|nr:hypothetical protein [Candidatus Peribacteria bacterium]